MSLTKAAVHREAAQPAVSEGRQGRTDRESEVEEGDTTRTCRHSEDLRAKCDPETEREAQPLATRLPHRCRELESTDCGHDAASHKHNGKRREGHGWRNEEHGSGEGILRAQSMIMQIVRANVRLRYRLSWIVSRHSSKT